MGKAELLLTSGFGGGGGGGGGDRLVERPGTAYGVRPGTAGGGGAGGGRAGAGAVGAGPGIGGGLTVGVLVQCATELLSRPTLVRHPTVGRCRLNR
jgi:hypothetical protein